jgi:glucokinase
MANDCDAACLAEARFGAGRGQRVVFYVTVGRGIGGGLVIDGRLHAGAGLAAAEIGHLRPGLNATEPDQTVESLASGWGIAAAAQARLVEPTGRQFLPFSNAGDAHRPEQVRQRLIEAEEAAEEYAADLLQRCDGQVERLTAKTVAQAAADGNEVAREVLLRAAQALGWAIAQTITLVAPGVVVIGGGVALCEESLLLEPLRKEVDRYVFPPLRGACRIARAELGELVVVHGALAIAAEVGRG